MNIQNNAAAVYYIVATKLRRGLRAIWRHHNVIVACWILLFFVFGCKSQAPSTTSPVESVAILSSSGTRLTLKSQDSGTINSEQDRTMITLGRKFQIEGEISSDCKVGDTVYLDMRYLVNQETWSTIANATAKVDKVQDGKGRFRADFYITDIGNRDGRLIVKHYSSATKVNTDAGSVDVGLRAGR